MNHNPLSSYEGWLSIDNRVSQGVPDELLNGRLPPGAGRGVKEFATLHCTHCGQVAVKNPDRTRPRNFCPKCSRYICDGCAAIAASPDYVHRSFAEVADLVRSGKYTISGGTAGNPILVPTEALNG
jgi:hypothetical protein